jgi:uncharacterized protein YndB with AHSA1/START domain
MTSTTRDGQLIETDGGVGVRFERRLAHSPERVWRTVTETEELAKWFPARPEISGDRRVGARLQFVYPGAQEPPETGEILELDEPRLFAFSWRPGTEGEPQVLRFELVPGGDGTRLVFTHELPKPDSAKVAAGWELCLDDLELALAGSPRAEFPEGRWSELHEEYAANFGVSPDPGREALRERQAAESS